jgi:hypothetical protein
MNLDIEVFLVNHVTINGITGINRNMARQWLLHEIHKLVAESPRYLKRGAKFPRQ